MIWGVNKWFNNKRTNKLESQLQSQIAILNEPRNKLNADIVATTDDAKKDELEGQIQELNNQINTLSDSQQMDMLRLQRLSNKRNEAFDTMTNFMKKMQDNRSSIISNMDN